MVKNLNEKASLYEGHGFSRAVTRLCLTASAAEVRFRDTHRFAVFLEVLSHPLDALVDPRAVCKIIMHVSRRSNSGDAQARA
jgi:hypothetical protein